MRTIRLCHGEGDGVKEGCLMTAANMLIGKPGLLDRCPYVCDVLRAFIIPTNDTIPEEDLGEVYGPLVWEILGTRSDDPKIEQERAWCLANFALGSVRHAFTNCNIEIPISLMGDARTRDIVLPFATGFTHLSADQRSLIDGAIHCTYQMVQTIIPRIRAERAAHVMLRCQTIKFRPWNLFANAIRTAAKIGDKRPVETVITHDQLCDALA